jgi:hypothetical protein
MSPNLATPKFICGPALDPGFVEEIYNRNPKSGFYCYFIIKFSVSVDLKNYYNIF